MVFFAVLTNLTDEQAAELGRIVQLPVPVEGPVVGEPDVSGESVGAAFDRAPGWAREVIRQEWPQAAWEHAALIGECESNWRPRAHNLSGEDSRGPWQINVAEGANTDLAHIDLFDPIENARAAGIVWKRQGWRAWRNCAVLKGVPLSGPGVP
jgi:hypothetical protein